MYSAHELRVALGRRRGDWPNMCRDTGLSYWWLTKFAQGRIKEPGLSKVQRLAAYFDAHPLEPDPVARATPNARVA